MKVRLSPEGCTAFHFRVGFQGAMPVVKWRECCLGFKGLQLAWKPVILQSLPSFHLKYSRIREPWVKNLLKPAGLLQVSWPPLHCALGLGDLECKKFKLPEWVLQFSKPHIFLSFLTFLAILESWSCIVLVSKFYFLHRGNLNEFINFYIDKRYCFSNLR